MTETTQKILVVEDDFANQQVAMLFLKKFGYETEIAQNGQQAVAFSEIKKYPLILMDCQMPIMDGFTAARSIRSGSSHNRTTPIIALTANLISGINEQCQLSGMDDLLNKPIKMKELQDKIELWYGHCSTQS
jgi:CheY-like chemotaxis protein